MKILRTLIGFALAIAVPAALVAILGNPLDGAFVAIFAFPAVLLLGLPAHLILWKKRWYSWPAYIAAGFIVGSLSEILYRAYINCVSTGKDCASDVLESTMDLAQAPLPILLVAYLGAIGALAFWFAVRPDTHSPASSISEDTGLN